MGFDTYKLPWHVAVVRSSLVRRTLHACALGYRVDEGGCVFDPEGRVVRLNAPQGYFKFWLPKKWWPDGERDGTVLVHHLAVLQWFGEKAFVERVEIRHKNGQSGDNSRSNLLLGSTSENQLDIPVERRVARAKNASRVAVQKTRRFSEQEVRHIRTTGESGKSLARRLRVSVATISYIRNRRTYKDVQ